MTGIDSPEERAIVDKAYGTTGIELGDVLQMIWAHRRRFLVALMLFSAVFWLAVGIAGLSTATFTRFTKDIKLVFHGVTDGRYPDATGFSPNHLIDPVILSGIYEKNDLAGIGVSIDLIRSLTASRCKRTRWKRRS